MDGQERDEAWMAYRICRLEDGSKKKAVLLKKANDRVVKMVSVMPAFLSQNCLAEALRLSHEAMK